MNSYDMNGNKQSFANWISMLRTHETPFINLTKTEKVDHVLFSWQTDKLANTDKNNKLIEGSDAVSGIRTPTKVMQNVTQILSKVVKVSDTAAKLELWGRNKETAYQMDKAGKEIFKDLEWAFLNNTAMEPGNAGKARITAGVRGLAADVAVPCPTTGAITHIITDKDFTEEDVFDLTYNLYLAGSKANLICFHPSMALMFSGLMESATKARIFKNNPQLMLEVYSIVDPLGQRYALIPMRQMPKDVIYAFNAKDFTQMVLRPPRRVLLDREGSYDKWLVDMEVGLRVSNSCAVGVLQRARIDQLLLRKERKYNAVSVQANQEAVDFVHTDGSWVDPTTEHTVHFTAGQYLRLKAASSNSRADKLRIIVYETTNGKEGPILDIHVPADRSAHEITIKASLQDSDENTVYRLECRGYFNGTYTLQELGSIKLVKANTP